MCVSLCVLNVSCHGKLDLSGESMHRRGYRQQAVWATEKKTSRQAIDAWLLGKRFAV